MSCQPLTANFLTYFLWHRLEQCTFTESTLVPWQTVAGTCTSSRIGPLNNCSIKGEKNKTAVLDFFREPTKQICGWPSSTALTNERCWIMMSNLEISQIAAPEASGAVEADRQEEVDHKHHMKNMFFYTGYIKTDSIWQIDATVANSKRGCKYGGKKHFCWFFKPSAFISETRN